MINRILIVLFAASLFAAPAWADQKEDEQAVLTLIQAFFDAIHARDANAMAGMMRADGQLLAVIDTEEGEQILRRSNAEYMARLPEGDSVMTERMWNPTVMVHGSIALAWTPYDFHVDGERAHCGVNGFTLVKEDGRWIIDGAVFTVEPEGCADSPLAPLTAP